jgi:hypothetical protein
VRDGGEVDQRPKLNIIANRLSTPTNCLLVMSQLPDCISGRIRFRRVHSNNVPAKCRGRCKDDACSRYCQMQVLLNSLLLQSVRSTTHICTLLSPPFASNLFAEQHTSARCFLHPSLLICSLNNTHLHVAFSTLRF